MLLGSCTVFLHTIYGSRPIFRCRVYIFYYTCLWNAFSFWWTSLINHITCLIYHLSLKKIAHLVVKWVVTLHFCFTWVSLGQSVSVSHGTCVISNMHSWISSAVNIMIDVSHACQIKPLKIYCRGIPDIQNYVLNFSGCVIYRDPKSPTTYNSDSA